MYILDMDVTLFSSFVRNFFATIDKAVYGLIAIVYNLIEDLANASILSISSIDQFATRVYSLVGIFMLFRISFSIITYIISPDKLTDSKSGTGSIIKRVIITLILIIFVPTGFNLLYDLQSAILSENIIPKFILGTHGGNLEERDFVISPTCIDVKNNTSLSYPRTSDNGTYISLISFRNFYQLSGVVASADEDKRAKFMYYYCGFDQDDVNVSYFLNNNILNYPETDEDLDDPDGGALSSISGFLNTYTNFAIPGAFAVKQIFKWVVSLFTGPEAYFIDYSLFVSTIMGIVVALFLITMAMDVAVRSVKLTFLQLLSPIPIISYISPDSKSNSMLKNWGMEVFRTWASLFIRLIALFFGIYLVQQLDNVTMRQGYQNLSTPFWIQFFLLLGILIFCKQLPKLLEELIPGMKLSGSLSLNPFKKFGNEAMGGKAILGTAGAIGAGTIGLAGAGIAHGIARKRFKKDIASDQGKIDTLRDQRLANASKLHTNNMQLHANRNQIKSLDNKINEIKAKPIADIADGARLRELKDQKATLEAKNANILTDNKGIRAQSKDLKSDMKAKQDSLDQKIASSKLDRHPVSGFMGSVSRGAMYGMKEGYKNPKSFLKGGINAITKASQNRNYRDQYGFADRARDRYTDIVGIKNNSGTTSEVKRDMRTATLALDEVNRNISMLERTISNYADRVDSFNTPATIVNTSNNRMTFNTAYKGPDASQIQMTLDSYNQQIDQKIAYEKQIKNYEDILSSKSKKE